MSLDPSIDLSVEILDVSAQDAAEIMIAWLRPLLPDGQVSDARLPDDPIPAIVVTYLEGEESLEQSQTDDLISVHILYPRGLGNSGYALAARFCDIVHARILLLARYLEDVILADGRTASIDYLKVFKHPEWVEYADEQILRKVGRYRMGLQYVNMS